MISVELAPSEDDLLRELNQLEGSLKVKALRSGLVRAVKPIKAHAKENAPTDQGNLKQAIGHVQLSARAKFRLGINNSSLAILVGANRKVGGVWQGRKQIWHEFGTEKMSATPFLERALQYGGSGFEERFYQGLSMYLNRLKKT